ncbi:MAG: YjbH domain-containing protein [Pseudoxanthomonas sp.]
MNRAGAGGLPALGLLALVASASLQAQTQAPPLTHDAWGGIGLLETPSARMAEEGEFAFTASHASPYSRYNVSMQPFPWLEGTFRYINVIGARYGPEALSGDQNYKDKSIDVKLRLWRESRRLPQVALGIRDLGGTGLFSGEYLVASKRFGTLDANLGFATGYLGNRGDFGNPLGVIDDRFETRPGGTSSAGKFGFKNMFRGRVGVFGGIAWQTPWEPLSLKLEYDGNDYGNEPRNLQVEQDSPFNLGLVYRPNSAAQFTLGWERGNELAGVLTLRTNLAEHRPAPKPLDPPPLPMRPHDTADAVASAGGPWRDAAEQAHAQREHVVAAHADADWAAVARQLRDNAGFEVESISVRGSELVVSGTQGRYFYPAQGLGRAGRILDATAAPGIDWFTLAYRRQGMSIAEASIDRDKLADYAAYRSDLEDLARGIELNPPAVQQRDLLYQAPLDRFDGSLGLGYKQIIGGPDGFVLYQFSANYFASWRFSRNVWLSGTFSADLLNNFDRFRYDAPSNLPRVRTYMRQYLTTSDFTVPNLQLTATGQLSRDLYGMAYAGFLEPMFGGVGGELLYRPMGQPWAIGVEANWVKQRDFPQHAGFRDYEVATGHASLYYRFGEQQRVLAAISAGRYLAGDWGATVNLSRQFGNGVSMGAWATKTDVSSAEFGEGSFDKGIYVSIPFDFMLPRSTRSRYNLVWNPLTRDGGARLSRSYSLYGLTGDRDAEFFFDNLDLLDR